jgi:hypothetical protein
MKQQMNLLSAVFEPDENAFYDREAMQGFAEALEKNFWRGVAGLITRQRTHLLSFDEIAGHVPFEGQYDAGIQEIPVDRIMGSVGRALDFGADFSPRSEKIRPRWLRIARANLIGEYIPPIEVFQVGAVYFVQDGNHRVSVARVLNQSTISAHVVVLRVPEELARQADLDLESINTYDRETFERRTSLARLRPDAHIEPTLPGFYRKLLEHIATHRWLMGEKRGEKVPWEEAVLDWYDSVYAPVQEAIRENFLLAAFPGRSEADLYLWISEYAWFKSKGGLEMDYTSAARTFTQQSASHLPRLFWKVLCR